MASWCSECVAESIFDEEREKLRLILSYSEGYNDICWINRNKLEVHESKYQKSESSANSHQPDVFGNANQFSIDSQPGIKCSHQKNSHK